MKTISIFLFSLCVIIKAGAAEQPISFSQADRDRLIKTEVEMTALRSEMNVRFEQVDKRFEELRSDMNSRFGWMISLFTAMMVATIGFALWDRRTMIRPFETKVKEIDIALEQLMQEKTANKILTALRELAKKDSPLAEVLRTYNLL